MQTRMNSGIFICTMARKVSKKGNQYFAGYSGRLNFALLKGPELDDEGQPIWNLFVDGRRTIPTASTAREKPTCQPDEADNATETSEDDDAPF